MLPMGEHILSLLRCGFLNVETDSTIEKLVFIDTGTNKLSTCVHLLLIVYLNSKLFFAFSYVGNFCKYR